MLTMNFTSAGRTRTGRVVTSANGMAVLNPYDRILVLVDQASGNTLHHGRAATVKAVARVFPTRAYRRVLKFLASR